MPLQGDNVADLIITTLKKLGRGNFNEIVTDKQEYVGLKDIIRGKNKSQSGGYGVQRNIMVGTSSNARWTGLYATETTNKDDVMKNLSVPHRIAKSSWMVDEIELAMNSGPEQIVSIIETQKAGAEIDLAEILEVGVWTKPPTSSDTSLPYGLQYWLVYNATTGFNGGIPTGFSDVGGLSPTTYPNFKNYTAQYTNVTEDDLFDKLRTAMDLTNFMPPTEIPEYGKGFDWGLYGTQTLKNELIKVVRGQNENLGMDVTNYRGMPVIGGHPYKWVPAFESADVVNASSDPIFGVNWRTFECLSLQGWQMRDSAPMRHPNQPTVRVMYKHTTFNLLCNNRRKNFLIAKADPTPA